MLIYHLLLSVGFEYNREVVERLHHATDLKPVYQVYSNRHFVFSNLIQKRILDVNGLFTHAPALFPKTKSYLTVIRAFNYEFLLTSGVPFAKPLPYVY